METKFEKLSPYKATESALRPSSRAPLMNHCSCMPDMKFVSDGSNLDVSGRRLLHLGKVA